MRRVPAGDRQAGGRADVRARPVRPPRPGRVGQSDPPGQRILSSQTPGQDRGELDDRGGFHRQPGAAQLGRQRPRLGDQVLNPVQATIQHPSHGGIAARPVEHGHVQPFRLQPVQRHIDPVQVAVVVLHVLQMVDHLQRAAQRVRRRPAAALLAMQVEQEAADRVGGELAIAEQILPIGVAELGCILLEGRDQIEAMAFRHAGLGHAPAQAAGLLQRRVGRLLAGQGGGEAVEPGDLVVRGEIRIVGDVVDRPGKGVVGGDMGPQRCGEEETSRPGNSRPQHPCRTGFRPLRSVSLCRRPCGSVRSAGGAAPGRLDAALPLAAPAGGVAARGIGCHGGIKQSRDRQCKCHRPGLSVEAQRRQE